VRPSALAVLRLMTSSNLEACSTGRSPGLVPRRILSAEQMVFHWKFTGDYEIRGKYGGPNQTRRAQFRGTSPRNSIETVRIPCSHEIRVGRQRATAMAPEQDTGVLGHEYLAVWSHVFRARSMILGRTIRQEQIDRGQLDFIIILKGAGARSRSLRLDHACMTLWREEMASWRFPPIAARR
jgi:hypothetical protein